MKMKTNDKIEHLLDMTEHPEKYSEEEMKRMLEDDECRTYYELMVKTNQAYTQLPSSETEKALQEFEAKHHQGSPWHKIAAIFIGIITVSCLTYAAIAIHRHSYTSEQQKTEQPQKGSQTSKTDSDNNRNEVTGSIADKEKLFDNVELQTILNDISSYYHLQLEFESESSKNLRLHYRWDRTQGAAQTIEALNHFEKVNIKLSDGKITVE
jgi:hypothetical protein